MNRRNLVSRRKGQAGLTLIELLVTTAVTTILLSGLGGALMLLLRTPPETVDNLTSSASAFQTGSVFADDIQSAGPETGELAVTRDTLGCGGDPKSLVRAVTRDGGNVQVRSYSVAQGGKTLERRVCTGPDQAQALLSAPQVGTVVTDLDPTKRPTVTCRASTVAEPAPMSDPDADFQCRLVSMTVTTASNLVFTVDGRRNTVETELKSEAPSEPRCTMVASADTYVSSVTGKNYSRDGEDNGEFVVQGGAEHKEGFLKFDLLSPCVGENEPRFLPGGKTLTGADLSLMVTGDNQVSNNRRFRFTMLPSWFLWNEYRLTRSTIIGPCVPASETPAPPTLRLQCNRDDPDSFVYAWADEGDATKAPRPLDAEVLGAVNQWYSGAKANNGWMLDRDDTKGTNGKNDGGGLQVGGWRIASKESKSSVPKLVVTWDPKS